MSRAGMQGKSVMCPQCQKVVALSQQQQTAYDKAVMEIIAPHVWQHHSDDTQAGRWCTRKLYARRRLLMLGSGVLYEPLRRRPDGGLQLQGVRRENREEMPASEIHSFCW